MLPSIMPQTRTRTQHKQSKQKQESFRSMLGDLEKYGRDLEVNYWRQLAFQLKELDLIQHKIHLLSVFLRSMRLHLTDPSSYIMPEFDEAKVPTSWRNCFKDVMTFLLSLDFANKRKFARKLNTQLVGQEEMLDELYRKVMNDLIRLRRFDIPQQLLQQQKQQKQQLIFPQPGRLTRMSAGYLHPSGFRAGN